MSASPPLRGLHTVVRGTVRYDEPLARHTTLRIGGPADVLARPADEEDLRTAAGWVRERGGDLHSLGLGSNLLVPDEGVRGVVVQLDRACTWCRFADDCVEVGAGYPVMRLLADAAARGLGGGEGLAGVPGSVGGALVMNAGTPGGDIARVTRSVRVLLSDGSLAEWQAAELGFGYRTSRLQREQAVVLSAVLALRRGDAEAIRRVLAENAVRRRRTQPLELPNAGSTWTNPPGDHAGRLIEAAGCKGWQVGRAQVSPKHANFVVNLGGATAADVIALMARVRRAVREHAGVRLEPEVRWLRGQRELEALLDRAGAAMAPGD